MQATLVIEREIGLHECGFFKRLDEKRRGIYRKTWDIRFGLHSNIPKCCILAYITSDTRYSIHNYALCKKCSILERFSILHHCNKKCRPLNTLPKNRSV